MARRKKNKKEPKVEVEEEEEENVIKVNSVDDIAFKIDNEVYDKVMHWVDKAVGEISGFGKVELIDGVFYVTSAILLKQENTSASTEIDAGAVAKAMYEMKDEPGHLNWWWHSHVNMPVFWSGTDMDTIQELGEHGWICATVFNKKEEMRSAYYQKGDDFLPKVFIDNVPTGRQSLLDIASMEEWDREFDEKVTVKVTTYPKNYGSYKSNYRFPGHQPYTTEDDKYVNSVFDEPDAPTDDDDDFEEEEILMPDVGYVTASNAYDKFAERFGPGVFTEDEINKMMVEQMMVMNDT